MKKILSGILSAAIIMSSMVSYAAVDRNSQSAELHNLLNQCVNNNYAVDYEKAAIEIFDWYKDLEAADETEGKLTGEQRSYNAEAMTEIYTETKTKLNKYISEGHSDYEAIKFPTRGTRNIKNNIFVDANRRPLQSVGFGHSSDVFTDADLLKNLGSNNIQTEIGPNLYNIARQSEVNMWKIVKNNGCNATVSVEQNGGNKLLRVTNNVNESTNPNTYLLLTQTIPVEQGQKYTISLKAKANAATTLKVLPNGFGSAQQILNIGTTEETFTINNITADNYYTQFMIISSTASVIDIDDVSVIKVGDTKNVIKNGDFEREGSYCFDEEDLLARMNEISELAAKGYSVDLLLSPHYMPTFMKTIYSDMMLDSANGFLEYNINHPMAKQFVSDYVEYVMPFVANCTGIKSVCLSNEASFSASKNPSLFNNEFRAWLTAKYGTISKLNSAYGTSYSSFNAVSISSGNPNANTLSYDIMLFNEDMLANWHKMMSDIVKEYAPNMPVHAKIQDYLYFYDRYTNNKLYSGTDIEKLADYIDIAGNDAVIDIDDTKSQQGKRSNSRIDTMMWYDMLASTTGKPVYNSENHMMNDGENGNTDAWVQNVRYSIMNSAVHGLSASTIWNWQRNDDLLFKYNPKAVYEASKSFLDLTRLTNKFAAFQQAPYDVAFFYSKASRLWSIPLSGTANDYTDKLETDYKAVAALGHKTGFVTETAPSKVNNYNILILTDVQYIPEESVTAIYNFMRNGGKVIIDGSSSNALKYNENGKAVTTANRTYIKNNAAYVSASTTAAFSNAFVSLGYATSPFTEGGAVATGLDVKKASVNGNELIYVTNLTDTTKTVVKTGKYEDLISGAVYQNTITLNPYEPVMLAVFAADYSDDEGDNDTYDETLTNEVTFDADIEPSKVTFSFEYTLGDRGKVRAIVIAKDSSNNVVDFAYSERISEADETCTLNGEMETENVDKVELVIFNAYNGMMLHKRTER